MSRSKRIKRGGSLKGAPSRSRSSAPSRTKANSDRPKYVSILEQAGDAIRTAEAGYHEVLRDEMAKIYGVAQSLAKWPMRWNSFCRLPYWKQVGQPPDKSDRADALRFVLRFTFGLGDDASKKASFYYRALKSFWDGDVSADKVSSAIKAQGGFKKLAAKGSKRPPGDELPEDDVLHDDEDEEQANTSPRGAKTAESKKAAVTFPAVKEPPSTAVDKKKPPLKGGSHFADLKAEFDMGVSFSPIPAGKRFVMEGTLMEIGKVTVITVHRIDRAPAN